MTPGGRAMGCGPDGSKSILYKHSHAAYQIDSNEEENTVVQKFCPGGMSGSHQRSKSRLLGPLIVTQLLSGFLARTLKLSQVIAL